MSDEPTTLADVIELAKHDPHRLERLRAEGRLVHLLSPQKEEPDMPAPDPADRMRRVREGIAEQGAKLAAAMQAADHNGHLAPESDDD